MKIGVIASTYPRYPGDGSGRFVRSLAEALTDLGHHLYVLAPYYPKTIATNSAVTVHHFRYIWPDALAIMGYAQAMESDRSLRKLAYPLVAPFFFRGLTGLAQMTKKYQLDALHAHWVLPNAPIAALIAHRYRLPLIISLHGSDIFVAKNNPILKRIARWAFSKAIAISACSPDLVEGALEIGASPERIHLIPWGADPNVFKQNSRAEGLRTRWKIPHRKKVVLSLGRLVKKKGIEYLVGAMPHILPTCPDTQFVIVGDGPELDRLKKLATDLKVSEQVVFTGSLPWDEVPAAFQLCDIFVVPSIYDEQGNVDGLPTTILEAMAAGKPVVASNVAGIPLVVAHQKTGLLTKEADVFQLSEALIDLLNSDKRRLAFGWEGRKRVDRQLNWREVAKKFEQFLKT